MKSAVVYLRISEDRTGRQSGVSRQLEDCELLANRRGLTVAAVLVDNDLSAFDGTRRPGYEALIGHIRAGISRVVVWHLDRLYRQPRELEALIDLVEDRALRIETVNGGPFDLNTHEGRLMARQFVAIAAYESATRPTGSRGRCGSAPRPVPGTDRPATATRPGECWCPSRRR